jgi:hypothetical protein
MIDGYNIPIKKNNLIEIIYSNRRVYFIEDKNPEEFIFRAFIF